MLEIKSPKLKERELMAELAEKFEILAAYGYLLPFQHYLARMLVRSKC